MVLGPAATNSSRRREGNWKLWGQGSRLQRNLLPGIGVAGPVRRPGPTEVVTFMEHIVSRRITSLALASLVLGLASLIPGLQILGLIALLLGFQAVRGMNQVEAGAAWR